MLNARSLHQHFTPMLLFSIFLSCTYSNSSDSASDPAAANGENQLADYIVEIFEDKSGNIWFGTMSYGAARFDGDTLTYLTPQDGLAGNTVVGFAEDSSGNLWFATHTGLTRYDGDALISFDRYSGLPNDRVSQLLIDREGTLWIGTCKTQ